MGILDREKYYNNGRLPGAVKKGSFWWRDVLKLLDKFKCMARVQINNGKSCYLWEDLWDNELMSHKFPELYSFSRKKKIVFEEGFSQSPIHSLFNLPLSTQAHSQMLQLESLLQQIQLDASADKWSYIWNSSSFSVKKAYKQLKGHTTLHPVYKWLWNSSCQNKHKVFFWLLIKDRLSTRELLRRKNMDLQNFSCVLCMNFSCVLCMGSVEESLYHLFLGCPFVIQCWAWINIQVDTSLDPFQNLQNFKDQLQVPFFMEIVIIMCWIIWKARNDWIFRQVIPNLQASKVFFREELHMLSLRMKRRHLMEFNQWITNLS